MCRQGKYNTAKATGVNTSKRKPAASQKVSGAINQSDSKKRLKITNATTGDFRKQFTDGGGSFATVLQQGAVESTGAAREVAIVRADDSSATTIAAVTSTVKNSDVPDGQARVYRMKLSLEKHDGRWLVSNVEFVA